MRVPAISFKGNNNNPLVQGRAEFEKLSLSKQAALEGIEQFSREHAFEYPSLRSKTTPLARYVSYRVCLKEAIKNTLANFKMPKL